MANPIVATLRERAARLANARATESARVLTEAADEIEHWRKQAELWKRAARCWLNVAHRFGTITPDQARDAINEAEEHERRV